MNIAITKIVVSSLMRVLLIVVFLMTLFSSTSQVVVYFDFDKHQLTSLQNDKLLHTTIPIANTTLLIKAFTDTVGNNTYNNALAQRRANSIKQYLLGVHSQYDIATQIIGENTMYNNDSLNRRVEISWIVNDPVQRLSILTDTPTVVERYAFTKIFFVSNTAIIKRSSLKDVENLYENIKKLTGKKLEIRGHINWLSWYGKLENDSIMSGLSLKRAEAIFNFLKNKGVAMHNISCRGMHNTEMLYPNPQSPKELEQNMRVEIVVIKE